MSSRKERLRLLLDTSYLLPALGVRVRGVERALEVLDRLARQEQLEAYYTPFNMVEALAKAARLGVSVRRVALGLRSIRRWLRQLKPTTRVYYVAYRLRCMGFSDMIDLLLYATARVYGVKLLTRDRKLLEFLESVGEDTSAVLAEEEFVNRFR